MHIEADFLKPVGPIIDAMAMTRGPPFACCGAPQDSGCLVGQDRPVDCRRAIGLKIGEDACAFELATGDELDVCLQE